MSNEVLRDIVHDIQPHFYSTIADEYTDITNKEQLSICVRWVDNDLNCYEDLLGFYNIPNINADTIVNALKDALLRLQLSFSNLRGQCYDGTQNGCCKTNFVNSTKGTCHTLPSAFPKSEC